MPKTRHQKMLAKGRRRKAWQLAAAINEAMGPVQFTCSNCGTEVPWRESEGVNAARMRGIEVIGSHDACPECEWSRHVIYGTDDLPPCGEMMEPVELFYRTAQDLERGQTWKIPFVVRRCQGCGWETTAPLQRTQAEDSRFAANDLCKWGADGDGKKMASAFAEHDYSFDPARWAS